MSNYSISVSQSLDIDVQNFKIVQTESTSCN